MTAPSDPQLLGDAAFVRRVLYAQLGNVRATAGGGSTKAKPRTPRAPAGIRHTARRLAQRYGAERAASITNGTDEAANADLAAWRRLGKGASGA